MNTSDRQISIIKKELAKLVNSKETNFDKILALSNQLLEFDKQNIRFSIDAGVINRLGKELVARHETALSELIKNAYDADATKVELIFEKAEKSGGTLTILDDGNGMDRNQLINGYMRIASTDKIHNPKSEKYKRDRAGRKGIGRFATHRLGKKLTIITKTKKEQLSLKVTIDWKHYELDKNLLSITNKIEEIPYIINNGTILIIEDLQDQWTEAQIQRVYRYASDLFQPFPLSKKFRKNQQDPGFKAIFYKKENDKNISIADEEIMFFQHALAEIEGYVDENGNGFYIIVSKKIGIDEFLRIGKDRENNESTYEELRNIHFKAYYFIYESGLIPRQYSTMIKDKGREQGGIRLYRNGFRVLPYGEPLNDWLGLDESVRRRGILGPHSNLNFFGFVEILDKEGKNFEEPSSREGLLENQSLAELRDFVFRTLVASVNKIQEVRGRKQKAGQKDWKREKKPSEKIREIADRLENTLEKEEDNVKARNKQEFKEELYEIADETDEIQTQLLDENAILRVLGGLGLTMAEFIHEIKSYLTPFQSDIDFIKSILGKKEEYIDKCERLEKNFNSFYSYTSYFDEVISRNVNREVTPIEIRDVINNFRFVVNPDLERTGLIFHKPEYQGYDLYTIPMHPSEWASIFFNLYTNSKKATHLKNRGEIFIRAGEEGNKIYIEFMDNGIGIPKENEEKIFDAFFTTTSPSGHKAKLHEDILGTGLGLKIVKDIVSSYGGEIFVAKAQKKFNTCIRIELPKLTDIDKEKYGL